jgi:hypothetical protein
MSTTTEDFVAKCISSLKPNKATGLDKISARLLKDAAPVIISSLTHLLNLSIINKTVPKIWKSARLTPLHKAGAKDDPSNFRPISILPSISKILERVIHSQLSTYLSTNKLLTTSQFGFRLNSSTVNATAKFTDNVLKSMDDGKVTGAIFLDLAKAFDTVNHTILLRKLSLLGLDANSCDWFRSFLTDRSQATQFSNTLSDAARVTTGVAQGSILGPLLFIIYVNDLPSILDHCCVTLFADDTVLYVSSKSTDTLQNLLNSDLQKLCYWLKENHLTVNIKKSKAMIIGSSQRLAKITSSLEFTIDNTRLDQVKSFKYLGVLINENLSWKEHVDHIKSKVNKKIGLFNRIKKFLPLPYRILFYNSYILPIFDYSDIVWGDRGNDTLMSELQTLQNKVARSILDLPFRSSASEALKSLSWKNLKLRKLHRLIFIYKCKNDLFSHKFEIIYSHNVHKYNTRSKCNIRKSSASHKWGHWTSVNFACNDWNSLDNSIREANNLTSFKNAIRIAIQ